MADLGQPVKPKKIALGLPRRSFSVTRCPSWLVSANGPPIGGAFTGAAKVSTLRPWLRAEQALRTRS